MKQFNFLFSLSAAILCVCATGCSRRVTPEMVTMKMNWQVGKRYDQQMTMVQSSRIDIPGRPDPVEQSMILTQDFTISALKPAAGGGTELELEFTGEKVTNKLGDRIMMEFDSDKTSPKDEQNPGAASFRKMIGAHFTYVLDADGKVTKIEGVKEFLAQISGNNPNAAAAIKSMLNEGSLKQLVTRGQGLPTKPVGIGDSWPVNLEMNAGPVGGLKIQMTNDFKGWDDHDGKKCALLEFSGNISSVPRDEPKGFDIAIDKGTISGKTWFDPSIGMVLETDSEQNMTVKMSIQGKTMTTQLHQNIVTKVVKISDLK